MRRNNDRINTRKYRYLLPVLSTFCNLSCLNPLKRVYVVGPKTTEVCDNDQALSAHMHEACIVS